MGALAETLRHDDRMAKVVALGIALAEFVLAVIALFTYSSGGARLQFFASTDWIASFGVHVTLIEPAIFSTDWGGSSAKHATRLPAYDEAHAAVDAARSKRGARPGDPTASGAALLKVVDAEEPPLRVFFGASPLETAKADYESRLRNWEQWQPVAELAQG